MVEEKGLDSLANIRNLGRHTFDEIVTVILEKTGIDLRKLEKGDTNEYR